MSTLCCNQKQIEMFSIVIYICRSSIWHHYCFSRLTMWHHAQSTCAYMILTSYTWWTCTCTHTRTRTHGHIRRRARCGTIYKPYLYVYGTSITLITLCLISFHHWILLTLDKSFEPRNKKYVLYRIVTHSVTHKSRSNFRDFSHRCTHR